MEYVNFGHTGLKVSQICLGTAGFSREEPVHWEFTVQDEQTCLEIVDEAIESGINFIDTANLYSYGQSEEIVGEAIQGRRDDLVIASKVGKTVYEDPTRSSLSKRNIITQVHKSLDRLNTDYIDLYYIHKWDYETPIEETLSALTYLVDEGLVRYIGASNLTGYDLMKALYVSDLKDYERFVCIQPEYNLVGRYEEENLLPVAKDQNLGVAPYAPLAAGFLTGVFDKSDTEADLSDDEKTYRDLNQYDTEANWQVLDEVRNLAEEKDATPVQISVAWLLHKDFIDAPIIGPKTLDHLDEYLDSLDIELTVNEMNRLEAPVDPNWDHSLLNLGLG